MVQEYKFMFDRRFDEDESEDSPSDENEDTSSKSVDGIPSISQLLDSLNNQKNSEAAPKEETPAAEEPSEEKETETQEEKENQTAESETAPKENEPPAENESETSISPAILQNVSVGPLFSSEQMNAAQEKAREEGRLSGLEEGRETAWQEAMASIEKQSSDILLSIDTSLKSILENLEQNTQTAFSTAIEFALAVCKKAVPALCETNAIEEIRSLFEKNLHFLKDEPKISLRLNPFLADKIKPMLADLIKKEAYSGKITVVRDDAMPVGDCRVEWKNGGLEKNLQDVLNHTEELVNLYTHTAPATKLPADNTGEEHHG